MGFARYLISKTSRNSKFICKKDTGEDSAQAESDRTGKLYLEYHFTLLYHPIPPFRIYHGL